MKHYKIFIANSDLNEKSRKLKMKINKKINKNLEKIIINFGNSENEKQISPISKTYFNKNV